MWIICPRAGLLSLIRSDCDPSIIVCRSRTKNTLPDIFGADVEQFEVGGRDYCYRAFLPASLVSEVLASRIFALDYFNVKGTCTDHALHHAMLETWHVFERIGDRRAYARRSMRKA